MGKIKKKLHVLKLLNPKYLQKEVDTYGYQYSAKRHFLSIVCVLLASIAVSLVFQLEPLFLMMIVTAAICVFPMLVLFMYRKLYEQKRFSEAGQYMEQMLYSFMRSQKIYASLMDTMQILNDGQMHETVQEAVLHIDKGMAETEKGILREAFLIVEHEYPCEKIHAVNEFMLRVEERGGEFDTSAKLLLMDQSMWMEKGYDLQAQIKQRHIEVILCILFSTTLSAVILYALNWAGNLFHGASPFLIFSYPLIQVTSVSFILFHIFVFWMSSKSLAVDWTSRKNSTDEKLVMSGYETVITYDAKSEQRKSLVMAAPFLIAILPAYLLGKYLFAVICMIVSLFLLASHKIGYALAKDTVKKEIYIIFPQWMMDLALLLQNNNVFVSIQKSYDDAPDFLKCEISHFMERMEKRPDDVTVYTDFLAPFEVQEVFSCMQMLYAVSETGNGDIGAQMENLLERILKMQENAQVQLQGYSKMKYDMIFSFPMGATCIKMAVDMTFGMLLMLRMLGSLQIGG